MRRGSSPDCWPWARCSACLLACALEKLDLTEQRLDRLEQKLDRLLAEREKDEKEDTL